MSSCEESGTERETCHSIKKSSPSSSSTNSRDSSPISSKPSRDNLVISEEESETNDIKILPRGYITALTPDGVLTPPNDGDVSKNGIDDAVKPRRSNGRLEFFKEGVLCLELSHEDEGETTKWLKIKSRSTFPNVVRVTKEVTIPCPSVVPPPMFTSPSHCLGGQSSSRVESCTSHSMSDDGSSVISSESPKLRYRSWRKQPVPQKSVSSSLQFFMKPASCFLNLKRKNGLRIPTKALERHRRRPYVLPDFSNEFDSSPQDAENNKLCVCENEAGKIRSFVAGKNVRSFKRTENGKSKLKFDDMITKLVTGAEEKVRTCKTSEESNLLLLKSSSVSPSKSKSTNHSTTLPRKRGSKEVEAEESCPPFRPIKKSPSKNQEKTILTVPGVGSVCNKTNSTERHNHILSKSPVHYSSPLPPSMAYGCDATDGNNMDVSVSPSSGDSNRSFRSNGNANTNKLSSKTKSNRSTSRAKKSSPPCSLLKPIPNSVELASTNNVYNNSVHEHQHGSSAITSSTSSSSIPSTVENEETLSPEEQQQFQQQAMSKAISYTINSLLGNGNSNIVSSHNDSRKVDARRTPTKGSIPKTSKSDKSSDVIASSTAALGSLFGVNEQDQNSFLRHLLDTSATIPSSTASSSSPPTISIKPSHATPKLLERSAINSINKTKSSSTNPKSRKGTKVGSNNLGTPASRRNSTNTHVTRTDFMSKVVPATSPASVPIPSEPVHQMSPYGYLIHPQQRPEILSPPTVTAFHQQPHHHFGSPHAPLLPAHLSMPKVVPHPYLGHFPAPNFTRLDYSNSNGETALNLSQRGGDWNLPNQNSFDRASNGPQDLSMRRAGLSYSDSMDTSSIDSDVPLNLCKKPRPN